MSSYYSTGKPVECDWTGAPAGMCRRMQGAVDGSIRWRRRVEKLCKACEGKNKGSKFEGHASFRLPCFFFLKILIQLLEDPGGGAAGPGE